MARKKQISVETRAQIEILSKEGYSQRSIAQKLGISRFGVQYSIKRQEETGQNKDRKRSGRAKATSQAEDQHLVLNCKRNRRLTAPELLSDLNSSRSKAVSLATVKRRLNSRGLYGRVAVKKPLLRSTNKTKRLLWARKYKTWSVDNWKKVLWTDESKFQLFGSNRRIFVRRMVGERASESCVVPTVKHGGGSVMVWGCFGGFESGNFIQVKGTMRKEDYYSILQRHAIPSGLRLIGRNFILQQDNDPKHSSKLCTNYIEGKERQGVLQIMKWPPQSPDLSPIELAWDELDRRVRAQHPKSEKELFEALSTEWNKFPNSYFEKLLQRMPRICTALLKVKGGYFDESKI